MIKLLSLLYYSFKEYDLYEAIQKTKSRLIKLNQRIMQGDYKAASLALEQLEAYDKLKIEFEQINFNS